MKIDNKFRKGIIINILPKEFTLRNTEQITLITSEKNRKLPIVFNLEENKFLLDRKVELNLDTIKYILGGPGDRVYYARKYGVMLKLASNAEEMLSKIEPLYLRDAMTLRNDINDCYYQLDIDISNEDKSIIKKKSAILFWNDIILDKVVRNLKNTGSL